MSGSAGLIIIKTLNFGLIFAAVTVVSMVFVALILRAAQKMQIIDVPNERSSHTIPTPRGGGLAIIVLSLGGWCSYAILWGAFPARMVLAYACAAGLVAVISAVDDLRNLSNRTRFCAHLLSAILVICCGAAWQSLGLPFFGDVNFGILGIPLALLWIVWSHKRLQLHGRH